MTAHLRKGTQPGESIRWARRQMYDTAKLIPKASSTMAEYSVKCDATLLMTKQSTLRQNILWNASAGYAAGGRCLRLAMYYSRYF